jgi:hypothetical protein
MTPFPRSICCTHQNYHGHSSHKCSFELSAWFVGLLACSVSANRSTVWGPEPFRLGFIGAPLASAISFNLMATCSIMYGAFYVPKTAWHPITARMFTKLGLLMRLGLGGVGQYFFGIRNHSLIEPRHLQVKSAPSGGPGNSLGVSVIQTLIPPLLILVLLVAASL